MDDRIKAGHDGFGRVAYGKVSDVRLHLSSAALDERRRRILFRAWRRGLREMDLVMGQFADANLPAMTEAEIDEFEALLEIPDPQTLAWITGGSSRRAIRHAAVRPPARIAARSAKRAATRRP